MKNAGVMLEFVDYLEIPTGGMHAVFDKKKNRMELEKTEKLDNRDAAITQTVVVEMSRRNNTVLVKNEVKKEVNLGKNTYGMSEGYKYKVDDVQAFTKFKANNGKMDIYKATVQGSIGEKNIDSDLISDMLSDDNMPYLVYGGKKIPVEKTTYSLPDGYKIIDGVFK